MSSLKESLKGLFFVDKARRAYYFGLSKRNQSKFEREKRRRSKKEANGFSRLANLCNQYKGERCFVLATGPSLTMNDVESLIGEYTFGVNSICKLFDKTDWRPTFLGIQDEEVFIRLRDSLVKSGYNNVFIADYLKKKYEVPSEWISYPENSVYHSYDCYFNERYYAEFSLDATEVVYDGYTIVYSMIQIAAFLGFSEIYLLGCDCDYSANHDANHFVSTGVIDPTFAKAGERMIVAYQKAKEYCGKSFDIYNSTRGGKLEVFERRCLEDVLAGKYNEH